MFTKSGRFLHLGDVERIKKELEEERSKTLSELGQVSTRALVAFILYKLSKLIFTFFKSYQVEQKARRDEIEKEGYQRDAEELRKRLAKTEEAKEAIR